MSELVSVDTAAAVMGVSKRTLWRWLSSGTLQRQGMDERGRVMIGRFLILSATQLVN